MYPASENALSYSYGVGGGERYKNIRWGFVVFLLLLLFFFFFFFFLTYSRGQYTRKNAYQLKVSHFPDSWAETMLGGGGGGGREGRGEKKKKKNN